MDIKKQAAALRREYMKDWRNKNKDKVKKHTQDYWERKAVELAEDLKEVANDKET